MAAVTVARTVLAPGAHGLLWGHTPSTRQLQLLSQHLANVASHEGRKVKLVARQPGSEFMS